MTRFKRRFLIGLGLAAVIVVGLGVWFYHFYFRSTGAITRHAENFRFRRMTVAQLAEQESYRFFFITNRNEIADEGPLLERYGTVREAALKYGFFDTRIEPSVGLGMLIDPTEWFQNEEIQLKKVATLERDDFVQKVRQVVQDSPFRSLFVVVHGFREAFPSALRKTAFLGHVIDINSPVLVFDWPGNQGSSLGGYRRARQVAEASGEDLARTLELIIRDIQPERLWLLANSMGGQVVVDAFGLLYQNPDLADAQTEIEDVVLTAPDVDHAEFDNQFKNEIKALAKDLTVYVSSNDRALLISRLINRGKRAGESTLSPNMLEEAERLAELVEPGSDRLALVDVTPVNRTRNFHNFSLETPEFFDDLFLRLTNQETPSSRLVYRIQTPEGAAYYVLTRGR
ncbi:MAG: alpha/beta fold hydrolase [Desulfobacterales bacterium]|nr:alpha/beta fold hydrolase [Desulfobacterales bacterium]